MTHARSRILCAAIVALSLFSWTSARAQITPQGDAYTNSADPTTNFGANTLLDVDGASQISYIQFPLTSIPSGATVSAATLKLYVNAITTAGSVNVDYVNGSWSEGTITFDTAPALGSTIVSDVSITTADKNQYILINVTSAVQAWLSGSEANDGIALVANGTFNASFDSKENSGTSHPAELDIAYAGGDGTITGITTATGSGLTGGGTSGTLNMSIALGGVTNAMLKSPKITLNANSAGGLTTPGAMTLGSTYAIGLEPCSANQILEYSGTAWSCASAGTGTITGVTAGTGLSGGGASGSVTLTNNGILALTAGTGVSLTTGQSPTVSVNASQVPLLSSANTFTNSQTVSGNLSATGVVSGSSFQIGSNLFGYGSATSENAFLGFAGNTTTAAKAQTAIGFNALASDIGDPYGNGSSNTAVGAYALALNNYSGTFFNSSAVYNSALGAAALNFNTTGSSNTASGANALFQNTTGGYNTASGSYALQENTTGSWNTGLGYLAGVDSSAPNLTNATAIGAYADVKQSNALVLGCVSGVNSCPAPVNVGIGTATPAYSLDVHGTGNFTGLVNFAGGQTFPGTITGVNAGTGLSETGTGNITLNNAGILTLAAGVGVSITAGQSPTVGVNTLEVPLLNSANTFTGNQTANGNLTATGMVSGSGFQIGSNLFDYGSYASGIAYLGFSGNTSTTGLNDTAVGYQALLINGSGESNTASGAAALSNNTTGLGNSAVGAFAGETVNSSNMTGFYNTFVGYVARASIGSLSNATVIGANAEVSESNALVLGGVTGTNGGTSVNVGIGTTAPASTLDVEGNAAAASAPVFWLRNNAATQSGSTGNSVDLRFTPDGGGSVGTPNAYIRAQEDGSSEFGTSLQLATVNDGNASGATERMRITSGGNVGIGTTSPDTLLSVNGSADKPGGGSWGTFSDRRLKDLDGSFRSGLSQIMQIDPVLYRYKEENAMGITDHQEHVGVVAQEVQKVIPEAVSENSKGYLLVNNDPIIWTMLNAIKEQQELIQRQQAQIAQLTSQVKAIKTSLRIKGRTGAGASRVKTEVAAAH